MANLHAVIGAGYGDEGKGLITDWLSSQAEAWVVRFNGGAQAGHTVVTKEGQRHVFSHFGSGTFTGNPTFLSRFFVCHPLLFRREWAELNTLGFTPQVSVDPDCPVTTPIEMWLNQALEIQRGGAKHGSCGIGFGETWERETQGYSFRVRDLQKPRICATKIQKILRDYYPSRCHQLRLQPIDLDPILTAFQDDIAFFLNSVQLQPWQHIPKDSLIFEGAQGLQLDMTWGNFPHVTRSHTGLRNVLELCRAAELNDLTVHYVHRCYQTRHGAGPLPHELPDPPYPGIHDSTNRPNPWQNQMRFAYLDLDRLLSIMFKDLSLIGSEKVQPQFHLTCADQVGKLVRYRWQDNWHESSPSQLAIQVQPADWLAPTLSWGPTRQAVEPLIFRAETAR
ncbi:MAG: adenylosuccinate synthetase [Acidobacteria bacterium]|nr:adenylosuccinate synthetase [Acidobacteriota bacterium]MCB9396686.1 adenylosuccinate synthetase [Acidobacteriota bacterium]